jgi:hypothetical protein
MNKIADPAQAEAKVAQERNQQVEHIPTKLGRKF